MAEVGGAHVVKAFTPCHDDIWRMTPPESDGERLAVPLYGDDPTALAAVSGLVADLGCVPGGLERAHPLEATAAFVIGLLFAGRDPRAALPPFAAAAQSARCRRLTSRNSSDRSGSTRRTDRASAIAPTISLKGPVVQTAAGSSVGRMLTSVASRQGIPLVNVVRSVAGHAVAHGYDVVLANGRGVESLAVVVSDLGTLV